MTNEEKYKTQSERATAFSAFCKRFKFCKDCPARSHDYHNNMDMCCHFTWLAFECEEEPLPCPCCGEPAMVREMPRPWTPEKPFKVYKVVCGRCGLQTGEETTSDKAVALWNRRMK